MTSPIPAPALLPSPAGREKGREREELGEVKDLWPFGFCAGLGAVGLRLGAGGIRWERPAAWLPPETQ